MKNRGKGIDIKRKYSLLFVGTLEHNSLFLMGLAFRTIL